MNALYAFALYCAFLPMAAGVLVFLLWLVLRSDGLMLFGALVVVAGMGSLAVALAMLVAHYLIGTFKTRMPQRALMADMLKGLGMVLANFLVAGIILVTVRFIECRYTVVVHNATQQALQKLRISGAGVNVELGPLAPGASAEDTFCIMRDGSLKLDVVSGNETYSKTIAGYVSVLGGTHHREVSIKPAGEVTMTPDVRKW